MLISKTAMRLLTHGCFQKYAPNAHADLKDDCVSVILES